MSRYFRRKRFCKFTAEGTEQIDYKDLETLKEYITEKSKEREAIQKEINELNEKRRKFIAEKKKATDNGLEGAMINALKKQAGKKNYTWQ